MSATRFEEVEQESPEGSLRRRVTLNQVGTSPGGTERVLRSQSYHYKATPPNEGSEARKSRRHVKREARQRAMTKFDDVAAEKAKAKRRKKVAVPAQAERVDGEQQLAVPAPAATAAPAAPAVSAQSVRTRRDWALLQAYKQVGDNPSAVLLSLQLQGLDDDEDEPWTPMRVSERRDFLCRSVRAVARLVGNLDDAALQRFRELRQLCA